MSERACASNEKENNNKLTKKSKIEKLNSSLDESVIDKLLNEETSENVNNKRKKLDDSFDSSDSEYLCSPEIKIGLFL